MTDLFCPEVIAIALLAGFIIGWLAKSYVSTDSLSDYDEGDVDRQAWDGVRDRQGRFIKLV